VKHTKTFTNANSDDYISKQEHYLTLSSIHIISLTFPLSVSIKHQHSTTRSSLDQSLLTLLILTITLLTEMWS